MNPLLSKPYEVKLLGGLQVQHGDHRITRFSTYKIGALLAYLVYHPQPHPRELLVEIFWPEGTSERQRNNLSLALSSLRNQLEPPGVPAGAVIVADRHQVSVNGTIIQTDVSAFRQTLLAASSAPNELQQVVLLQDAVALYPGELLPGYYEDWIFNERQRLQEAYIQTLRRLIPLLVKRDQVSQAIDYSLRLILADPFREEAHRDLMKLYVAAGQPSAALQQFRELTRLLEHDLQAKPAAATQKTAQDIETLLQEPTPPAPHPIAVTPNLREAASAPTLPGGTITFFLSDIASFTRQWEHAGDAFRQALETHHTLLRQQFARYGGHEFKEVGDSFLVAFGRASDALACAIASQRALQQQVWPAQIHPLVVRIALHTGEATPDSSDYYGPTLNRASRLVTAAHGGQILCSETTVILLQHLPSDVHMSDLGLYRLRDMPTPEHLFQANYPGMPQHEFPAPNAEAAYTDGLPLVLTRFIGREQEKARLRELLLEAGTHLVTVTGIGGTGKTRLTLEVARQLQGTFAGAVWFVPLADLADAALILSTIAAALRIPSTPSIELPDQVVAALSRQPSLLILDNFEQFVETGGHVVQTLIARIPNLTILVTSRQVLHLSGEREFSLQPLSVPSDGETPEQLCLYDSVQLFLDRAQTVKPDFRVTNYNAAAVATLCDRLEGIPLAIELAAARAQVLTPAQMLAQMQNRFDFLATRRRDATDRHRTLRAAMEWSYRLLSPALQRFFARLSVFRGGWTWDAAERICEEPLALDYLAQLREASLVLAAESGEEIRFCMLETVREYAADQLTEAEGTALLERHLDHFLRLAEEVQPKLQGVEQAFWFARLETEHDNLRVALRSSLVSSQGIGLRLSAALQRFWEVRGHLSEARAWYTSFLVHLDEQTRERAEALHSAGILAYNQADYGSASSLYEDSLTIARGLEDKRLMARVLNSLGLVAEDMGESIQAQAYFVEMLSTWREIGDQWRIGMSLLNLGNRAEGQGEDAQARAYYEEALAIMREKGARQGTAFALKCLGGYYGKQHAWMEASAHLHEAMNIFREDGNRHHVAWVLRNLAALAAAQGNYTQARTYLAENISLLQEISDRAGIADSLELLASQTQTQGHGGRAARLWGAGERLREEMHTPTPSLEKEVQMKEIAKAQEAFGAERFTRAWAEGRAMTMERAIAYALEELT